MKSDDIIQFKTAGTNKLQKGRVVWAKGGKTAVIINDHLLPWQRDILIIPMESCEPAVGHKGETLQELATKLSDEELKALVQKLKGGK